MARILGVPAAPPDAHSAPTSACPCRMNVPSGGSPCTVPTHAIRQKRACAPTSQGSPVGGTPEHGCHRDRDLRLRPKPHSPATTTHRSAPGSRICVAPRRPPHSCRCKDSADLRQTGHEAAQARQVVPVLSELPVRKLTYQGHHCDLRTRLRSRCCASAVAPAAFPAHRRAVPGSDGARTRRTGRRPLHHMTLSGEPLVAGWSRSPPEALSAQSTARQ